MKKLLLLMLTLPTEIIHSINKDEWITILIHGTVGLRDNFTVSTFFHLLRDDIDNTTYKRNVLNMREHPYLYTSQSMQNLGLNKVNPDISSPCGAHAFAVLYNELEKNYCPQDAKNDFYTFGWTGLLSYKQRIKEAKVLYNQLKRRLHLLKKDGRTPKVRIIAYSHGGNLALNLGAIRSDCYPNDKFVVDELVVLGMPVQQATSCLVYSSIFKQIYHIYSPGDAVQRLDVFSPCNLISHKKFTGYLPTTLTQVELKVIGKLLKHPEITLPQGLRGTIDQSPGHIEFWSFGWTQSGYRRNFVMFPLPVAVYIPYILSATKKLCSKQNGITNVCLEIWPDEDYAIVTNKSKKCIKKVIPFSLEELERLQNKAIEFHPGQPRYKDKYCELQSTIDLKKCR